MGAANGKAFLWEYDSKDLEPELENFEWSHRDSLIKTQNCTAK
tara:strand:- start:1464 stop:1592 length:129 start_codon:yes stop_codon:yes gene_type:complete